MVVVDGTLVHGNIGDSEAVLCSAARHDIAVVALSEVHNPAKNAAEAARVTALGGKLSGARLCHPVLAPQFCSIAVSRSIGDLLFKHEDFTHGKAAALSGLPYCAQRALGADDLFVILACDGVWDVLTHEAACRLVLHALRATGDPQRAAEELVDEAYAKGSTDNITSMVLAFRDAF